MSYFKNIGHFFCITAILLSVSCCKSERKEMECTLANMHKHPIILPLSRMQCRYENKDTLITDSHPVGFRLVTYIDSSECSPCLLDKLYHWNHIMAQTEKSKDILQYIFIVAPKPGMLEDTYLSIQYGGLNSPVYIDTAYMFKSYNKNFPEQPKLHTFLINSKDSVILVGSPLDNKRIRDAFNQIISTSIN